jgi:hypothetical protein
MDHKDIELLLQQNPFAENMVTATTCHRMDSSVVWIVEHPRRPDKFVLQSLRPFASNDLRSRIAPATLICSEFDASNLRSDQGNLSLVNRDRRNSRVWEMEYLDEAPVSLVDHAISLHLDELKCLAVIANQVCQEVSEVRVDLMSEARLNNVRVRVGSEDWLFTDPLSAFVDK